MFAVIYYIAFHYTSQHTQQQLQWSRGRRMTWQKHYHYMETHKSFENIYIHKTKSWYKSGRIAGFLLSFAINDEMQRKEKWCLKVRQLWVELEFSRPEGLLSIDDWMKWIRRNEKIINNQDDDHECIRERGAVVEQSSLWPLLKPSPLLQRP